MQDALEATRDADAVVVLTEWNEFRALAPQRLSETMKGRIVVDLRNIYDPSAMRGSGFSYHCVGRPAR